jgi:hypothetical protein
VKRLAEITFPHRESFLYLTSQHDSRGFWEKLLLAFRSTNSAYGFAIDAMSARGGIVPDEYFPIISGSPTRLRGHISAEKVRDALQRLGVLKIEEDPKWKSAISLRPHVTTAHGSTTARARMLAEDIVADATRTFLQRTGIGSYGKIRVRTPTDAPSFGAFKWDITAPCYLSPLRRYAKGGQPFRAGFVVADILLGSELQLQDIKPFLAKTEIMRSKPKTPQFLSMSAGAKLGHSAPRERRAAAE